MQVYYTGYRFLRKMEVRTRRNLDGPRAKDGRNEVDILSLEHEGFHERILCSFQGCPFCWDRARRNEVYAVDLG